MTDNKLPHKENCTGCGACANACPANAISMSDSDHPFIIPEIDESKCIDCGICTKTCPILTPEFKNNPKPGFYSFNADDQTRRVSSSGGIFSVLADYVFEKGGYVCGAAFDGNFQLKHRIICSRDEMEPLRYSKYVQSDINNCYSEVKKLLEEDKYVLFTGTPCQVAGLYGVLKKDHEKLITADLLCKGVPPQKYFDAYLRDISNGKKIKNVYFRNKRFGWSTVMHIEFEDSTEYIAQVKGENRDPYYTAFLSGMMMRDTCYDCKFRDYPRQGDITIGDLWESARLDPKSNDKKGTSFVFVNNVKGEAVFNEVSKRAKYYNEIPVKDYSKIPNNVLPRKDVSPLRERFIDLMDTHGFVEAFHSAWNGSYDIGLVGMMGNENIGSVLTYYALYHVLCDMDYSVLMIERPLSAELKVSTKALGFLNRWLPEYARPYQYKDTFDMRKLNKKCRQFVVGSDQIYIQKSNQIRDYIFFLHWVDENKNKVGYACSFGGMGVRGTYEYNQALSFYLNKFSALSVRENNGVDFANNTLKLDRKAEWCIDPVFLCDKEHYMKLIRSVEVKREGEFIGAYVLIPRAPISSLIQKVKEHFGNMRVELIGKEAKILKTKELIKHDHRDVFPIEASLEIIYNSKFFVTDSFHGVCLSIIFRKDFLVIPRDFPDRFTSLLDRLGLNDRIIKSDLSNLREGLFLPIDYDKVYGKLSKEIENSRNILINALKKPSNNDLTNMDILMRHIKEQHDELKKVKSWLSKLNDAYAGIGEGSLEENDKRILQLESEVKELKKIIKTYEGLSDGEK